jgi:hypothetical protein
MSLLEFLKSADFGYPCFGVTYGRWMLEIPDIDTERRPEVLLWRYLDLNERFK